MTIGKIRIAIFAALCLFWVGVALTIINLM